MDTYVQSVSFDMTFGNDYEERLEWQWKRESERPIKLSKMLVLETMRKAGTAGLHKSITRTAGFTFL